MRCSRGRGKHCYGNTLVIKTRAKRCINYSNHPFPPKCSSIKCTANVLRHFPAPSQWVTNHIYSTVHSRKLSMLTIKCPSMVNPSASTWSVTYHAALSNAFFIYLTFESTRLHQPLRKHILDSTTFLMKKVLLQILTNLLF